MAAELIIVALGSSTLYAGVAAYFLQQRINEIKEEKKVLQARNDYLLEKLVPVLRKQAESSPLVTAKDIVESKKHSISLITGGAACACGEKFYSDDPGKLQEKIEEHHKQFSFIPVRLAPRKSWPHLRDKLEQLEEEIK